MLQLVERQVLVVFHNFKTVNVTGIDSRGTERKKDFTFDCEQVPSGLGKFMEDLS
jgi:hypothetical protein